MNRTAKRRAAPPDAIPELMRERAQWVGWGAPGKKPKCPVRLDAPHVEAKSTDPATWASYELASERRASGDGIGFVFTRDTGLAFIDVDCALDAEGSLREWARPYIEPFIGKAYIETSPSGRGLHIFALAEWPKGRGGSKLALPEHRDADVQDDHGRPRTPEVAVYAAGRYSTVTGEVWGKRAALVDMTAQVNALVEKVGEAPERAAGGSEDEAIPELTGEEAEGLRVRFDELLRKDELLAQAVNGERQPPKDGSRSGYDAMLAKMLRTRGFSLPEVTVLLRLWPLGAGEEKWAEGDHRYFHRAYGEADEAEAERLDALEEYRRSHIFVVKGSLVGDLTKPAVARFITLAEAKAAGRKHKVQVQIGGTTKAVPLIDLWMADPRQEEVHDLYWRPTEVETPIIEESVRNADGSTSVVRYANTFQREHHDLSLARPELLKPLLDHVEYLYGAEGRWWLQFVAHRLQRPWELPPVALFSVSRTHGMGRGWLDEVAVRVLGKQNTKGIKAKHLDAPFDNWRVGSIYTYCGEVVAEGKKSWEMESEMRDTITAKRGNTNLKYGEMGQAEYFAGFMFQTNEPGAIKLTDEDRRLLVIEVLNPPRPEGHFKNVLYPLLDDPAFVASVAKYLGELDVTELASLERAPMNDAKRRLIETGSSPLEAEVMCFLKAVPAKAFLPRTLVRCLNLEGAWGVEPEKEGPQLRAILRKRCRKPTGGHKLRCPGATKFDPDTKVIPWVIHAADMGLSRRDLMVEVEKAERWMTLEEEKFNAEGGARDRKRATF